MSVKERGKIEVWPPRSWTPQGRAIFRDLEDNDPRARVKALQALACLENPGNETWRALDKALSDDDERVRAEAVLCGAELNHTGCIHKVAQMSRDSSLKVRVYAVGALGTLGLREGLEAVLEAFNSELPKIRKTAVIALAEIGGQSMASHLRNALKDEDATVRWAAAAALGDIEDTESSDELAAILSDGDDDVSFEAAYSLAKFGDARGLEVLKENVMDSKRGFSACEILGKLGDQRAVESLQEVRARLLINPMLKLRAAASLVLLGFESEKEYVVKKCTSRRVHIRQIAQDLMNEIMCRESDKE